MTPFFRLYTVSETLYQRRGKDQFSLLRREMRTSVLGILPVRRAARKISEGGLVSSWRKQVLRRTPSRCTMTAWTWKPSRTSVTPCGIPSCERHRGESEVTARPPSSALTFPVPSAPIPGGLHPPAALPRTPGHTMKCRTRTCRCAVLCVEFELRHIGILMPYLDVKRGFASAAVESGCCLNTTSHISQHD